MFNLIIREIYFRFVSDTDLFTKIQKGLKKGEIKKNGPSEFCVLYSASTNTSAVDYTCTGT